MSRISKLTGNYRCKLIISVYQNWIKQNDTILDIGCGTGIISKTIKDHFSVDITCCDINNYLVYKMPFIKIKNKKIPIRNKAFDIAFLNDVMHHINKDEQENVIRESIRVAKKLLIFDAEPSFLGKLADIILNKYHYNDLKVPLSFRTVPDWQKLFKEMSLHVSVVKIKKPFWYPFEHIAFLITEKGTK